MARELFNIKQKSIRNWRKNSKAIEKFQFVKHFLPSAVENKRASLLSHKALIVYCLLLLLVSGLFRLLPVLIPGVLGYASNINVSDLLTFTNAERSTVGLSTLRLSPKLSEAAENKARDMFANDYWAHVSPAGTEPWDFILDENYDYTYAGENLAKNFSTSKEVVTAWLNSPSHKDNLLSKNYDEVGFAVVNGVLGGYETTLVVQMFGRPRLPAQIATVDEENTYLSAVSKDLQPVPASQPAVAIHTQLASAPAVNAAAVSRGISITFVLFLISLLALDIWYSKKRGILKFTGHTVAHISLLVFILLSIWFVLRPGVIL